MDYSTCYYNPNNINNHHPSPLQSTLTFLPSSSSLSPSSPSPSSSSSSRRAKNNANMDTNTDTDKKQKKKKGVMRLSTDPQSVAARERRHRISERFKTLQSLVPGGKNLDTVSMLEQAIQYVKFLKAQIWLHQTIINNDNNNNNYITYNNNDNNNYSGNNNCGSTIDNDVIYSYYNEDNMMSQEEAVLEAAPMADFSGYEMLCEGIDNGSMYYYKRSSFEYYGNNK